MWEKLNESNQHYEGGEVRSARLSVPNGWIVRTVTISTNGHLEAVQTFVEDADHTWKV